MKSVVGLGNALVDVLTVLKNDDVLKELSLPKGSMQLINSEVSSKILSNIDKNNRFLVTGGSASNTISGLAKLGTKVGFVGKVGSDDMGDFFVEDCKKNNVEPIIIRSSTPSGVCVSLVSADGERTMATCLGAACEMSSSDLKESFFKGYDFCHIEGYWVQNHELIEQAIKLAKVAGAKVSLDLASYNVVDDNLEFLRRITKEYVDVVFANEEEAKSFSGLEADVAADFISEMCDVAVVKLGAKGAIVKSGNERFFVPSLQGVKCVDTTGAGDLFASGFLYGLINGADLETCGKYGSITAGNVIQIVGTKMSEETWKNIRSLL